MVILLIGVLSGVALVGLNPGGVDRRLREETDRLVALIDLAASEAVMQNREYGLMIGGDGYAFLCLDEPKQRWLPCEDRSFRARDMPDGMRILVLRESNLEMTLSEPESAKAKEKDDSPRLHPDIYFLSSGEASPASLEIVVSDEPGLRREITIDEIGRVTRDDEEERQEHSNKEESP